MKDFFFQAEDGIRDWSVTGVQTCALPISVVLSVTMYMSRKPHRKKGEHPMSTEENKALAGRLIEEAWNQGNLATVDELMAPIHVGHHSLVPNQPGSREFYKQYIVRTRSAFPDFHATIEDQIAEGDLVVTRWL